MTRESLAEKLASVRRFGVIAFTISGVIGFGPFVASVLCKLFHWNPVDPDNWAYIIWVGLFASFPVLGILAYWGQQRSQVLCPNCRRSLVSQYNSVVATGICPYCRMPVFDSETDAGETRD